MKPSEVLAKAASLIESEGAWIQGALTLDADGNENEQDWQHAVCFCASGAIGYASNDDEDLWDRSIGYLDYAIGCDDTVPDWNDHPERTQAEVVKALRDAADLARAEGC